jgi:D-cysteine desulfhydrase
MVCDSAEYFYKQVQQECDRLHLERDAHKLLQFRDARGLGYSVATREEVAFQRQVAQSSGIMLDSCYSGKAAYALARDMKKGDFSGKRVLFIHTGGVFGLFALPRELAVDQTLIHHYE